MFVLFADAVENDAKLVGNAREESLCFRLIALGETVAQLLLSAFPIPSAHVDSLLEISAKLFNFLTQFTKYVSYLIITTSALLSLRMLPFSLIFQISVCLKVLVVTCSWIRSHTTFGAPHIMWRWASKTSWCPFEQTPTCPNPLKFSQQNFTTWDGFFQLFLILTLQSRQSSHYWTRISPQSHHMTITKIGPVELQMFHVHIQSCRLERSPFFFSFWSFTSFNKNTISEVALWPIFGLMSVGSREIRNRELRADTAQCEPLCHARKFLSNRN